MTLDEAIKNLKAGREDAGMIPEEEYTPTMDLAIEALERVRDDRQLIDLEDRGLLPGETEE